MKEVFMKKLLKSITYYFMIWELLVAMAFASDASKSMHIKLTPIAVSADKVLFATQKYESVVSSVRSCAQTDFGWLVVSSSGIWDEKNAYSYDCKKESKTSYEKYAQGSITVKTPDKTLEKLMQKYEFYEYSVLENEAYVYAIKPEQSCFKGACLQKSTKQKTLGKLSSTSVHGAIRSSFYYKGVALFHNMKEDLFGFRTKGEAYGANYIDGLVLFDPYAFIQPSRETKKEVEAVVKEMFHLFHTKDIDALNEGFIHPKYGFYHMYRPGAMDVASHHMKLDKIPSKTWTKENNLFRVSKITEVLKWESVEIYCENPTWTKEGIFVHQMPYSSVLAIWKYWEGSGDIKPSKSEKENAKFLMKDVFVIVDTKEDVVFYIKKIDGKWYLTHIDRAASDCSA